MSGSREDFFVTILRAIEFGGDAPWAIMAHMAIARSWLLQGKAGREVFGHSAAMSTQYLGHPLHRVRCTVLHQSEYGDFQNMSKNKLAREEFTKSEGSKRS